MSAHKSKKHTIKALEVVGKDAFVIKSEWIYRYKYLINGKELHDVIRDNTFTVTAKDSFQYIPSEEVDFYQKGKSKMSVEEWDGKETYYHDESSDEHILRCIANKKEKEGYEPVYKPQVPTDVELEVIGSIADTGSEFIDCVVTSKYSSNHVLYKVHGGNIARDEYLSLSEKHQDHASFGEVEFKDSLEYVKVNNTYVFDRFKPFGKGPYISSFTSLEEAIDEEVRVREKVRSRVSSCVFKSKLTDYKQSQILHRLKAINKSNSKSTIKDMISVLISDMEEYEFFLNREIEKK